MRMRDWPEATGKGSLGDAPNLSDAFRSRFRSVFVQSDRHRHHVVLGGEGPPLLMLAGWPQCWFAWRYVMPELADSFSLIVVDPRGVGLSDPAATGYDSGSQAADMFALMDALGVDRFAFLGHDIGTWTGFAMAKAQPDRIVRMIVGEALIPGVSDSPPLLPAERFVSDLLSHFNFNRLMEMNEALVAGREEVYFGHQFRSKAGSAGAMPAYAGDYYIELLRDPARLRASFDFYRALDMIIPENERLRAGAKIAVPVATYAGALCVGDMIEREWRSIATDVTSVVIAECGHFPAEEKPDALLSFLREQLRA